MRLAIAHDGGQGDLVEIMAHAVLFQGRKHLEEASGVADYRHVETQVLLEALEHLGGMDAELTIIERGFPHMGDLLAYLRQLLLVYRNIFEAPIAPDFLGLQLDEGTLRILFICLNAGSHDGPKRFRRIGDVDVMLLKNIIERICRSPIIFLIGIQIFQRSAHIKHNGFDHSCSSCSASAVVNVCVP